jgi:hypothetical protein
MQLSVGFGEHEQITITRHAIERFRQRVAKIIPRQVPAEVSRMFRHVVEIPCPKERNDGRVYLKHSECTFVLTKGGKIVTVLTTHNPYDNPPPPCKRRAPVSKRKTNHYTER